MLGAGVCYASNWIAELGTCIYQFRRNKGRILNAELDRCPHSHDVLVYVHSRRCGLRSGGDSGIPGAAQDAGLLEAG
jgi:hypothetical protein